MRKQSNEKNVELERCYTDLDESKGKLSDIYMRYDLTQFDK